MTTKDSAAALGKGVAVVLIGMFGLLVLIVTTVAETLRITKKWEKM